MTKNKLNPRDIDILGNINDISDGARKGEIETFKLADGVRKRLVTSGIRYQCQKCGDCCRKGFSIELSIDEMEYLTKRHPQIKKVYAYREGDFVHPFFNTGPGCNLLKDNLCSDYRNRPFECKYFPFHLEEVNASTPGAFRFGKKYYQLYVYENCNGLDKGEVWSDRKLENFVQRMLREFAEHKGMLNITYRKLTNDDFFKKHKRYGSGVIYGTDEELKDFLKDYRSKFNDVV